MSYTPASKPVITDRLDKYGKAYVYRTSDMARFKVTGVGENVFILKDRHGLEHTRQFSGFWLVKNF